MRDKNRKKEQKKSKVDLTTTTVNVHVLKLKRGLRANRRAAHVVNFEPFTGEVLSELLEAALGGAFLVAVTTPEVVDEMVEANPQPPNPYLGFRRTHSVRVSR